MTNQAVIMTDLLDFVQALEVASTDTSESMATKVIHQMGNKVAALAYFYAPKDTMELANSIRAIHSSLESRVVAEAPHAVFVEFGTWSHSLIDPKPGTYTIKPRREGGALRFRAADGRIVYARKVEHPGIKPQLFMTRANEEVVNEFTSGIADVGVRLVLS